ncbi:MAG: hypothetical protein KDB53_06845, partial [Planctomycetes bacterium]|nr:hypothetical protein [Planctomycetota bacterium]
ELRWFYPINRASPGAQVLAYHPNQRNRFGPYPIFVTGTYGDGPVFFSAVDETWRWFYLTGPSDFNRFWGNVVRHLARAHLYRGSKRFKLVSDASEYQQGETVELKAFVRDRNYVDATDATWKVMVVAPGSQGRVVEFVKIRDGEFVHSFKPVRNGRYEAWLIGEEGIAGPHYAPISFEVEFIDPERQNPAMNEPELKRIAEASGGGYFALHEAEGLFERLKADTTRRSSVVTRPIKSRKWLPALFLLFLTIEWLVRKRMNLA